MKLRRHLLGALLALTGCSSDFAPYSSLDRLRILAVQAEPATPLPGEITTFSALTFAPDGEAVLSHWTWCPVAAKASAGFDCPLDEATARQLFAPFLDVPGLPSLDLGTAATASFANPFSTAALARLCSEGLASPLYTAAFDCEGVYPVTVVLDASTASASLRAGFVLRLPASDTAERNRNPQPFGLALAGTALADTPVTIRVAPGATVDLHVDIPADAPEQRSIPPSEGPPGQRLERLTTSWFATSGDIDKARTSFIDGVATLEQMASNRFTAPKSETWPADGLMELAVVVRDDRGGEGWLVRQVQLEALP